MDCPECHSPIKLDVDKEEFWCLRCGKTFKAILKNGFYRLSLKKTRGF